MRAETPRRDVDTPVYAVIRDLFVRGSEQVFKITVGQKTPSGNATTLLVPEWGWIDVRRLILWVVRVALLRSTERVEVHIKQSHYLAATPSK